MLWSVQGVEHPSPWAQQPWDKTSLPWTRVWQYWQLVREMLWGTTDSKGLRLPFLQQKDVYVVKGIFSLGTRIYTLYSTCLLLFTYL